MKLVLVYTAGDGYTYSCTEHRPFEYESAEAALIDFEELLLKSLKDQNRGTRGIFTFCRLELYAEHFKSTTSDELFLPEILTLDEWFEAHKATV